MSPEQEAHLRAQMAQARQEMEAEDLDSVQVTGADYTNAQQAAQAGVPERPFDLREWEADKGEEIGNSISQRVLPDGYQKRELPSWLKDMANNSAAATGKTPTAGAVPALSQLSGYTPAGYFAHHFLDYKDKAMDEAIRKTQENSEKGQKIKELSEQEENLKKAMENAKRIKAYQAAQEKATKDRDETIAQGGRGYRVERPLYDSTLYRK